MLETACFPTSIFGGSGLHFGESWASMLEPSWPFWAPRTVPGVSKIQSFGSMSPRCFPRGSKVTPIRVLRRPQRSIFEGFSMDLGSFFRYFILAAISRCKASRKCFEPLFAAAAWLWEGSSWTPGTTCTNSCSELWLWSLFLHDIVFCCASHFVT